MEDRVALLNELSCAGATVRCIGHRDSCAELWIMAAQLEPLHRLRERDIFNGLTKTRPMLDLLSDGTVRGFGGVPRSLREVCTQTHWNASCHDLKCSSLLHGRTWQSNLAVSG